MSSVEHTVSTEDRSAGRQDVHVQVASAAPLRESAGTVMATEDLHVYYGDFLAVQDVDLTFGHGEITALIGPSGCGKSTVLRCLNRMNDLIPGARVEGKVTYHGLD